jgi:MoaA/NifB/PqqE/SkfB family radical SAM enzyme
LNAVERIAARFGLGPSPERPTQVHLSVTDRCFLPCVHCDIHRNRALDLPGSVWERAIDELAAWLGPVAANFVGGEPLLRPDLEALMARAARHGFTVSFNTNGHLIDRERAASLADAGVSIAYLSLDGIRPATVDATRGVPGAFDRALAALRALEAHPAPRVVIATILHGGNAAELPELLEWVLDRGHQLVVQPLYQNFGAFPDPTWHHDSPLWPRDPGPVHEALDRLVEARLAGRGVCNAVEQLSAMKGYFEHPTRWNGLRCQAGTRDLALDPRGGVRLCFMREPVGSVLEAGSLRRAWSGASARRRRREISRCTWSCNLLNCNFGG